ncbi:hypothetical protein DID74_02670 [Candidatus Marinamargulisbacteria bacterium SCGC AG-333-B06]|nr:hypothetical protein DID74_02670 [Candidatus Marinamargulisbacteria bacterium SCGC AG-333-B06]
MTHIKKGLLLSLLITTSTYGFQEVYDFHNIRQKAMGGTQVATAKDSTSFYQNPALLALEKSFKIAIPRIEISINKTLAEKISEFMSLEGSSKDEQAKIDTLKDLVPLKATAGGNILPALTFTKKGFGLTAYAKSKIGAQLKRKTSPTLYMEGNYDVNVQLGLSHTIEYEDKKIHMGLSPRYISRSIFYNKETGKNTYKLTQTELLKITNGLSKFNPNIYQVSGISLDYGALYQYKSKYGNGLAGLTIKNLVSSLSGTQKIVSGNQTTKNEIKTKDNMILTIGNSLNHNVAFLGKIELATDFNLIAPTDSIIKRIHIGAEKKLTPVLSLRGGLNQGFVVCGFAINLFILKIDYAYFAEEFSSSIGKNIVESHNFQLGMLF